MLIMTQDRVSGLASDKSPLRTYGPGNTRDESNRNSWVSSDGVDKLTVNCLGQVNGLFLGRYQADEVLLTYQGDEMFSNKTSAGFAAVGYANGTNGVINGTISGIEQNPGGYYYSGGTLVTITLSVSSDYINVNDLITIAGTSTAFDGFHRVVQVQQDTSFTRLNGSKNSSFFQTQGQTGNKIQVILDDNLNDVNGYLSLNDTCTIENGISVEILPQGLNNTQCGIILDEDDIKFNYFLQFAHSQNSLLKSGDSPFTVGEYITFEDCVIRTNTGAVVTEDLVFSSNSYKSYYVSATNAASSNFTVFVEPSTYLSSNLVSVITAGGSPKANLGSSLTYSGGGYQHRLGLGLISGTTLSTGTEEFQNTEVIEVSSPSIASLTFVTNAIKQLELNGIEQTFLHKTTIKNRFQFSIKLPYKFTAGNPIADTAFLFSANDSIKLKKYVVDTEDVAVTETGAGTPIRRISVATRTQNSVADFVTGKLTRVESNYIPLPREAFPTTISVEMNSTLNHNAANLFNQFLLEEVDVEDPRASVTDDPVTITDSSDYTNYDLACSSYKYNNNDDGELTLYLSVDTKVEAGDYIYLSWPNNIAAQNNQISRIIQSSTSGTTFRVTTPIHELYEGMKVNGTNNTYILSIDTTTNEIITNIAISNTTPGTTVTFDHHPNHGSEAHNAWTGFHRVTSSLNNGRTLTLTVQNAGVKGDLTINDNAYTASPGTYSASGAYIIRVSGGKGRFVRPIASGITQADAFLWNSHPTNDVHYTYNGNDYEILPGTAKLIFSAPHSLVNNDKILLYNLGGNTTGAQHLKGLDSSYLVTYSTSTEVNIEIDTISLRSSGSIGIPLSSMEGASTSVSGYYDLLVTTSEDHNFSVGDKVTLNNLPSSPADYNGQYVIKTVPTAKSFSVDVGSNVGTNPGFTLSGSEVATTGVHYLTAPNTTIYTNTTSSNIGDIPCSRSVSIENATSSFENPIEVGNLIYRDSLQFSSSQYEAVNDANAVFTKTPYIDDAASTDYYRPDSDTAIQNTFAGTAKSIVSQINLVRGDATSEFDIHLVKPFGILGEPFVFTRLLQGLRVAILRAGVSRTLPNPQIGVTNALKDFSVRKELPTGAYYYLNRASAKEFSGRLISEPANIDLLVDFGAEQLARPFPCLVISGNKGNMKKLRTRTALYGYFTALPQATYSNKLVNLKETSFTIREVL